MQWLWVQKADNVEKVDRTAAIEEANEICEWTLVICIPVAHMAFLVKETTEKVENIKVNTSRLCQTMHIIIYIVLER